jgi:hypothetical protein
LLFERILEVQVCVRACMSVLCSMATPTSVSMRKYVHHTFTHLHVWSIHTHVFSWYASHVSIRPLKRARAHMHTRARAHTHTHTHLNLMNHVYSNIIILFSQVHNERDALESVSQNSFFVVVLYLSCILFIDLFVFI